MCTTSTRPSQTWLCVLLFHRRWIYDLLEVNKGLDLRESLGLELSSVEQYNQWASVGMHLSVYVLNRYYSTGNDDLETAAAILRGGITALPTILLLHLRFAVFLLAEIVRRHVSLSPPLTPLSEIVLTPEIEIAKKFMLYGSGSTECWCIIKNEIERRFGHEDASSEDWVNTNSKKLKEKKLNLAVTRALQKETLSDKAVAQMLAGM